MQFVPILFSVFCLLSSAAYGGTIVPLQYTVETSNPQALTILLLRNETVDPEFRFTANGWPMNMTGATVILALSTNGVAVGSAAGIAGRYLTPWPAPTDATNGWATVRCAVNTLFPSNLTSCAFTLSATTPDGTLQRAFGTITIRSIQ
jgi:hypothetical protein